MTFNDIFYPAMLIIFAVCLFILIYQRRKARKRRWQREDDVIRNIKEEL